MICVSSATTKVFIFVVFVVIWRARGVGSVAPFAASSSANREHPKSVSTLSIIRYELSTQSGYRLSTLLIGFTFNTPHTLPL